MRAFALCICLPVLIWLPWIFGWDRSNFLIFQDKHNGSYLENIKCVFYEWMEPHKKKISDFQQVFIFFLTLGIVPSARDTKSNKNNPAFKVFFNLLFHIWSTLITCSTFNICMSILSFVTYSDPSLDHSFIIYEMTKMG